MSEPKITTYVDEGVLKEKQARIDKINQVADDTSKFVKESGVIAAEWAKQHYNDFSVSSEAYCFVDGEDTPYENEVYITIQSNSQPHKYVADVADGYELEEILEKTIDITSFFFADVELNEDEDPEFIFIIKSK